MLRRLTTTRWMAKEAVMFARNHSTASLRLIRLIISNIKKTKTPLICVSVLIPERFSLPYGRNCFFGDISLKTNIFPEFFVQFRSFCLRVNTHFTFGAVKERSLPEFSFNIILYFHHNKNDRKVSIAKKHKNNLSYCDIYTKRACRSPLCYPHFIFNN